MKFAVVAAGISLAGCFASGTTGGSATPLGEDACSTSSDCKSNERCIAERCKQICESALVCGDTEACIDGFCAAYDSVACDNGACENGFYCNPATATCFKQAPGGEACVVDDQCASDSCAGGVCCHERCVGECRSCAESDTGLPNGLCAIPAVGTDPDNDCPGELTCTDSGVCESEVGATCAADSDCSSGFCVDGVCCDEACDSTCVACVETLTGRADGQCDAIDAGKDRSGAEKHCSGASACNGNFACFNKALGASCSAAGSVGYDSNSECVSGNCVDGVCCDSSCDGECQSCGVSGQCVNVANVEDDSCSATAGSGTCTVPPCSCDPLGACKASTAATCSNDGQCASGNCDNGICCDSECAGTCEACTFEYTGISSGTCAPVIKNKQPNNGACHGNTSCDGEGACFDGALGSACQTSDQCVSGHCAIDPSASVGVCCNTQCEGGCYSCDVSPETQGTCTLFSGVDPNDECAGDLVCGALNSPNGCFNGQGGDACSADNQCQSGFCCAGKCTFGWEAVSLPTTSKIRDVYVDAVGQVHAVGNDGTIVEGSNGVWTQRWSGTTDDLFIIQGSSDGTIVAAGVGNTVLIRRGGGWQIEDTGASHPIQSLLVNSSTSIAIVGASTAHATKGQLSLFNGSSWSQHQVDGLLSLVVPENENFLLFAQGSTEGLSGVESSRPFAVCRTGTLFRYSSAGSLLAAIPAGRCIRGMEMLATGDLLARTVRAEGRISISAIRTVEIWNGTDWSQEHADIAFEALRDGTIVGHTSDALLIRTDGTWIHHSDLPGPISAIAGANKCSLYGRDWNGYLRKQ